MNSKCRRARRAHARRTPHAARFDSHNKGHPLLQQQSRSQRMIPCKFAPKKDVVFSPRSSQSAATVLTYPVGVAGGGGRQTYLLYLFVERTTSQGWNQ
jgi:hypothetical protein